MPYIVWTKIKGQSHQKAVRAKIHDFLEKLAADDTTVGLHIEKMQQSADPRARTGRVDQGLRAVIYRLESKEAERTYVYAGTFEHDEAIERARTRRLQVNPVNGVPELIEATASAAPVAPVVEVPQAARDKSAKAYLVSNGYRFTDLTDELGFDEVTATKLWNAADAEQILHLAEQFEIEWQALAALGLAAVDAVQSIKDELGLAKPSEPVEASSTDDQLIGSLQHPAARAQFALIDGEDELRAIIEGEDFGAWRVFLHPDQRRYATGSWKGPFRLSGGAGTGKTVVLLHRAGELRRKNPSAKIVLTTFTKALAGNLERDLQRLDPGLDATALIEPGITVRGVDQLAVAVRDAAGAEFTEASAAVLGHRLEGAARSIASNDEGWQDALDEIEPDLPASAQTVSFLAGEYEQVVLPQRITTRDEYFKARRPGRGVPLDRARRAAVWSVVERFRKNARLSGTVSWAELSTIAAHWLETAGSESPLRPDHLLIDEAQDLAPAQWQLIRALVREGDDDLFIAEDSHQRIYGRQTVLSRYGIRIVGRSRRLTLNYRTTEENLRSALSFLSGEDFEDSEGKPESNVVYRSARRGPVPRRIAARNNADQAEQLVALVREWLDVGVSAETIAVLTRRNQQAGMVRDALMRAELAADHLTTTTIRPGRVQVLTMHTAKGMEFSRVALFDLSKGAFPPAWLLEQFAPEEQADVLRRERSLLYVAASRARDELALLWAGEPSELVTDPQLAR